MIFYIVTAPALKNMNQPPPENYYTLDFQQTLARCELKLALKLSSVRFYVFLKEDPSTIIGTVCLHNIIKMPYFTSEVGYKFDASYQHHGYAREALSMALSVGFYGLGLHKIFARCMPENTPSRNLLHATGFSRKELSATVFSFRENGKITSATLS